MAAPNLPSRFPVWCKAVYSFGGETKRDLGFLEGDYIECLNAGDGSWWTGRLKRDPRIIGKFPSNFVKVLDTDDLPPSLRASPMPVRARQASHTRASPPSSGTTTPVKGKSLFKKPFSAHAATSTPGSSQSSPNMRAEPRPKRSFAPYSSMRTVDQKAQVQQASSSRPPSPKIPQPIARGGFARHDRDRKIDLQSPPSASARIVPVSRSPSPAPIVQSVETPDSSPPPPPPPAHRTTYGYSGQNQLYSTPSAHDRVTDLHRSARSPSAELHLHSGFTPSPLRDAMDDVMTSLDDMRVEDEGLEDSYAHSTEQIWSSAGYGANCHDSADLRPYDHQNHIGSEHGLESSDEIFDVQCGQFEPDEYSTYHMPPRDKQVAMQDYVQRMQNRLESLEEEEHRPDVPPVPYHGGANEEMPHTDRGEYPYGTSRPTSSADQQSRPASSYSRTSRPSSALGDRPRGDSYYSSLKRKFSRKGPKESKSASELIRSGTLRSSMTETASQAPSTLTSYSASTQLTNPSLMSGQSAGAFSATSAGSLARRKFGNPQVNRPVSMLDPPRPSSPATGYSWHDSHASNERIDMSWASSPAESSRDQNLFGGLSSPAAKKRNLFQRLRDTAKTGAASARGNISSTGTNETPPRPKSALANGLSSLAGGIGPRNTAREMGLSNTPDRSMGVDWVQMRRDVNRANSLSRNERNERAERCQMLDIPVLRPVDDIQDMVEGGQNADGYPVLEPTDFQIGNLSMVDKSARFVSQLPGVINATSLAQTYLCRPYRSDVQRLRAIFTWVSERIAWEDDFEGHRDSRRVITSRRGCSEEIAYLVAEMCTAAGFQAEVVRGYLKRPGEAFAAQDLADAAARPNHWWNTVICDGEWRIMDCALANPSNPHRAAYSSANAQMAESWYFLARPTQICYTHIPLLPEHQHILPSLPHDVLLALPCACPAFFKNNCQMWDYDTSLVHLEGLEMAHVQIAVPDDVEIYAIVEAHAFAQDTDGDFFESGDVSRKRALAQAEFVTVTDAPGAPFKRYTIKAVLPSDRNVGSQGSLKIFAGKRGLQQGVQSNPHNLAVCLPLLHDGGQNPAFDFFLRHPTPHALRHELYVSSPLCRTLAMNNTFVFSVRQHPASPNAGNGTAAAGRPTSPAPSRSALGASISRPGSAMSMASISLSGSQYSNPSNSSDGSNSSRNPDEKPAKLAMQSPSGKIIRMSKKPDLGRGILDGEAGEVGRAGAVYETIIKIGERGTWRGLVLADRSARWCVFGEWDAI